MGVERKAQREEMTKTAKLTQREIKLLSYGLKLVLDKRKYDLALVKTDVERQMLTLELETAVTALTKLFELTGDN